MRGILGCRICRVRTCLSAAGLHIGHAKSNRMEEILVKYCALFGVQGATVRNRSYKVKPPVHHLFQVWLVCVHRVDHLQRVGPKRGWHSNVLEIFFLIKPISHTNFPNFILSKNSTYFGNFLCPSSGVFYCTSTLVYFLLFWWQPPSKVRMTLLGSCHQICKKYTNVDVQ